MLFLKCTEDGYIWRFYEMLRIIEFLVCAVEGLLQCLLFTYDRGYVDTISASTAHSPSKLWIISYHEQGSERNADDC